jgi:KDO2-lipid IV(A) lauroyltransferase
LSRKLTDWIVYIMARIAICAIQALPMRTCESAAKLVAWLATDVLSLRGKTTLSNLEKAYPELTAAERRDICRRMWVHLVVMICEIAHLPRRMHRTNWRRYITIRDESGVVECLLDPRPRVMVTGHFGNFEMAGYVSGLLGFPTYTIVRPLDNVYLNDYLARFRGATGQFVLPKVGSADDVQRVLDAGEIIALLCDQHAGPKGCWVEFFEQPTSSHKAVALFPLSTRAPLLCIYGMRTGAPMHFEIGSPGWLDPDSDEEGDHDVRSVTRWYFERLEETVRRSPEQYWWVHRIWRGEPPKRALNQLRKERERRAA